MRKKTLKTIYATKMKLTRKTLVTVKRRENKHPGNIVEKEQKFTEIQESIARLTRKHRLNRPETLAMKTKTPSNSKETINELTRIKS